MTEMKHVDFVANSTHTEGTPESSLMLMLTGSLGGGELAIERYSASRGDFVTVALYTEATTSAEELKIGKGAKIRFGLAGATTPTLALDYWFV